MFLSRPALACLLAFLTCLATAVAAPPNILVVLVDDLGWADLGCQGSQYHQTPHIDQLARDGMRFTDAYSACTVCSPTRAALLTGKHPARLHLTDWIPGHPAPKAKLSPPNWSRKLDPSEPTLASRLKAAGYVTASIGKWHLGADSRPQQHGFDLNLGGDHRGQPPRYVAPYSLPELPDGPQGEFLTDRESAEAVRFIEQSKDKPFFLYLAHYAVHTPLDGKPGVVAKYKARNTDDQRNPVYAALLESVDDSVGRIRARLGQLGLATNTVIVFTSDNGGLVLGKDRPTSNRPLRSGKGDMYEGGVRVPFIVCWPGVVRPGTTSSRPVQVVDLYPTLLEAAGVDDAPGHERDGTSLLGLLQGKAAPPDRPLFWHYPHYHPGGASPHGAIRSGDWKLVELYESGHLELYHLASDLGESTNLANALPEKANDLARELAAWRKRVGAQMPAPNPDHVPSPIEPQPDGSLLLPAHRSMPHGSKIQYEPPAHKNTVGYWVDAADWVEWVVKVPSAGRYEVEILQGCGTGSGGSEVEVAIANARLRFVVMETGGFQKFMPRRLGDVEVSQPGEHRLQIRVLRKNGPAVMDVRQVVLRRKSTP